MKVEEKEGNRKRMVIWSGIGRIPKYLREYIKPKKGRGKN